MIDRTWREKELSAGKPYNVLAIDYLTDGMIRVCIEKDGKIGEAQDYLATYRYPKTAEQALIKRALNSLEQECPICHSQAILHDNKCEECEEEERVNRNPESDES